MAGISACTVSLSRWDRLMPARTATAVPSRGETVRVITKDGSSRRLEGYEDHETDCTKIRDLRSHRDFVGSRLSALHAAGRVTRGQRVDFGHRHAIEVAGDRLFEGAGRHRKPQ